MRDIINQCFYPYRSYYALWRIFRTIFIPLFIQSLAVTFNDAAEQALVFAEL